MKDIDINDLLGRETIQLKSEHIYRYIKDKVILVTGVRKETNHEEFQSELVK